MSNNAHADDNSSQSSTGTLSDDRDGLMDNTRNCKCETSSASNHARTHTTNCDKCLIHGVANAREIVDSMMVMSILVVTPVTMRPTPLIPRITQMILTTRMTTIPLIAPVTIES